MVGTRIPCRLVRDHPDPLWGEGLILLNGLVCLGVERFRPIWICLFIRRKKGKKIASLAVFFPVIKI